MKTFFNPQLEGLVSPPAVPKDAAAVVLLRDPEEPKIFWVRRARHVRFMAGYHAFPGGQADADDALVPVVHGDDPERARMIACAAREVFEETGVLIARGDTPLTAEKRGIWRRELAADELGFHQLLRREKLVIDARDFMPAPRWVTPTSSPRRFNTRFFAVWLPEGQETEVIPGELELGEWLRPREALQRWEEGECLIATPILRIVEEMAVGIEDFAARLESESQESRDLHARIEMRKGFFLAPLRTPTIPPATHTNCYLIGGDELIIIDPGSPYPDEQEKLDQLLDALIAEGRRLREIIITHLHPDHIGGINHLVAKYSLPVAAHRLTAEAIADEVKVDRLVEDNELIELGGPPYWRLRALWTPGHARGHLSFYEERTGTLVTGDLVVGFGTVVIAPPEGHLGDYLASLRRLLALPRLTALLPGHGPILADARPKLEEYLRHRLEREEQILKLLGECPRTIAELVESIYVDVPVALHPLAAASVTAHLQKLEEEGRASHLDDRYTVEN